MGNGFVACSVETISEENLNKICRNELESFKAALDEQDLSFYEFCRDDDSDYNKCVYDAFEQLQAAFEKATTVGETHLSLSVGWHEEGDRYDEIEERTGFFVVKGQWVLSEAGKKFAEYIEHKAYVEFG